MADPVLFSIATGVICMAIGLVLGVIVGGLAVFILMKATEEP